MKVKELAELVGISVRTLHHYDAIGLLTPDQVNEAGYRIYSAENVAQLQQILFFRELDFPLAHIKSIVNDPGFDRIQALEQHRERLLHKQRRLGVLLQTLDRTLLDAKGEIKMSDAEKFKGFDFSQNPYEDEARQRWGDEVVDDSQARLATLQKAGKMEAFQAEMNALYTHLASLRQGDPASVEAQQAIARWYALLSQVGSYSPAAFKALGQMYVDDTRFTQNIDQFGDGLAVFMRDAMAIYAEVLGAQ